MANAFEFTIFDKVLKSLWYVSFLALWYYWGFCWGAVIYLVVRWLIYFLLEKIMGLELLTCGDELFFHEDKRMCANIMAF